MTTTSGCLSSAWAHPGPLEAGMREALVRHEGYDVTGVG